MTRKERNHVETLEKRRAWLVERISNYQGRSDSYDRAEFAALSWALRVIRHADEHEILRDLESVGR